VVPPKLIALNKVEGQIRFALTIISFSHNVENTVQTTGKIVHLNGSRGNFNRVWSGAISPLALRVSGGFCQSTFLCHCFYLGSPVALIICGIGEMSRLEKCLGFYATSIRDDVTFVHYQTSSM